MPGIDSCWTAEVAGSGATADVLAGVLGVLPAERDEHPAAALTNTQPAAVTTRTGTLEAGLRALANKHPVPTMSVASSSASAAGNGTERRSRGDLAIQLVADAALGSSRAPRHR